MNDLQLQTQRLTLLAMTAELVDALREDRAAAEALVDAEIPAGFPDAELGGYLPVYRDRLRGIRDAYLACGRDLVGWFRKFQQAGQLEIITSAATHALLPLLATHPPFEERIAHLQPVVEKSAAGGKTLEARFVATVK